MHLSKDEIKLLKEMINEAVKEAVEEPLEDMKRELEETKARVGSLDDSMRSWMSGEHTTILCLWEDILIFCVL